MDDLQRALAGRYVVEREIGSGGMATVYLARDVRHDRKVALKVLKPELGAMLGAERFLAEIKVTANLQHPNLLPLFDSGEADGLLFYVMPFVDGETLRARLERERQLPIHEAVRIAVALASALGEAHDHGIIHRDLKPENIMLHAGHPMIADFGIALALTRAAGPRITQSGFSLGTPQYSSPEQAAGDRQLDARTDIYSLGAVTYEMLAGEPPFSGPSVHAIIAKMMTSEPPPLRTVRPSIPANVESTVKKALAKIPADRFSSAREFADAITNPAFGTSTASGSARAAGNVSVFRRLLYGSAAVVALIAVAAVTVWMRPIKAGRLARYSLALDTEDALSGSPSFYWSRLAISPDGSRIVYVGGPRGQLLLRSTDALRAVPLPGTEGAKTPFFSPDGSQVGFSVGAADALKIVSVDGGAPVTIADSVVGLSGGSWGSDGFVYTDANADGGIIRTEARAGAVPKRLTSLDPGEGDHVWPDALPNGKAVLFVIEYAGGHSKFSSIAFAQVGSGKHTVLFDGTYARYAAPGYIIYLGPAGKLMAVKFDQDALEVRGDPIPLREDPQSVDLAVSAEGTLAYATRGAASQRELVWVTRAGKVTAVDTSWQNRFDHPSLSPDGTRLAVDIFTDETGSADIWIKNLNGGLTSKLTLEGGVNWFPNWTPDGRAVTFASPRNGRRFDLWTKRVDGTAEQTLQFRPRKTSWEGIWSPDGKRLIVSTSLTSDPGEGILAIRADSDTAPTHLAHGVSPAISPDGRFLAYVSNESGRSEIYVAPFPNGGGAKWQISTLGGSQPLWAHSGKEVFYRDFQGRTFSVKVSTKPTFTVGTSSVLFTNPAFLSDGIYRQYDISPDDQRFLMIRPLRASGTDKLIVVENWLAELNGKARK